MNYILRRRGLGATSCREIAANMRQPVTVVRNDNMPERMEAGDIVFRWGCTSKLPPAPGRRIVNDARAIHACNDKRTSRLDMQAAGVPVPKTWGSIEDYDSTDEYAESLVFRPARHAQGRHLYVVKHEDGEQIEHRSHQFNSYYISELIDKVAEYRVMVVSNRVAWVARKTPGNPDEVAWNVARGGRFDNVRWGDWPLAVCNAALQAAKVGQLDFGGVDVMVDEDGAPYVLEVNSAPSQTSPYRQECLAKCFDYIVRMGKEHFDDVIVINNWRDVIHPAIIEGR